jgi:hypothetical protein
VRAVIFLVASACGAAATTPTPAKPTTELTSIAKRKAVADDAAPVDPIAALAPSELVSYLVPGRVQIQLGGPAIDGPGGNRAIQVSLIETQGNLVRAAVRLEHARFSLWTDRSRLLAVLTHNFTPQQFYRPDDETSVMLHEGAVVRRLKHEDKRTQVRYVGALEIEAWVPDELLGDSGPPRDHVYRIPRATRLAPQLVWSGAVIRREPRWGADQLAVVATAYMLDTIREIDQAWALAAYDDNDLSVTGYVSRRDPPGSVHRPRDPEVAPQTITPNGKVPSGSCLYAQVKGEPIGYIVGDQEVTADDIGAGWWTVTIDSPWGPIPFAAQGPTRTDLISCAPSGSVPPSTLNTPPPAPSP